MAFAPELGVDAQVFVVSNHFLKVPVAISHQVHQRFLLVQIIGEVVKIPLLNAEGLVFEVELRLFDGVPVDDALLV